MSSVDARANILLVDDRPENLLALEAVLEPLGERLVTATSGEEALRHLLRDEFALILLDVQMPKLDGFATAELIKQRQRTRDVPIIFLTAISKERGHVFKGYGAGAVDYVFKPFDPAILRSKVSVFIDLHRKNQEIRRQAELLRVAQLAEQRRESEERYRQLADSMPQIVWTAHPEGGSTYLNARWTEYTGLSVEESLETGWRAVLHPDDRERMSAVWRRSLETGEQFDIEYRFRGRDGAYRWHLGRAFPRRGEHGEILEWVGTATDIDDAKRAEEADRFLAEASEVLASSLDIRLTLRAVAQLAVPRIADWCEIDLVGDDDVPHPLAVIHADPRKVQLAEELHRRYPLDPDSTAGPVHVVRTGDPELVPELTEEMLRLGARDAIEFELVRELGLRSWMCVPLITRGRPLGAIALASAESERRFAEADLRLAEELAHRAALAVDNALLYREAEERAQASRVLETIGDGVFLLDRDGVIRLWNPAAAAITGLLAEWVVGRPAEDAIPGWTTVAQRVPIADAPGPTAAETIPLELQGAERWLSIAGVGFEDGTVFAFRDLTEERALEELRQDLVATVSHELRTPLAAIYGSALTLRRPDVSPDEDLRNQLLSVIADESDRLAQIVNDLLLASQLDAGTAHTAPSRCDARGLAEHVIASARTHLPGSVELDLRAPKKLPAVRADPGQLRQVLANLVENGVKYSPEGGLVQVSLKAAERALRISVSDQGLGIPASEQRRIFEKFYRVDPNMEHGVGGTGLGLYICRELVRRIGGRIWVESTPGRGSTFHVDVPLAARSRKKAREKVNAAGARRRP